LAAGPPPIHDASEVPQAGSEPKGKRDADKIDGGPDVLQISEKARHHSVSTKVRRQRNKFARSLSGGMGELKRGGTGAAVAEGFQFSL
jgi:hypothetical protein